MNLRWWQLLRHDPRRTPAPRRFDREPSSPCVKVCRFSTGGDYCIGCRRTRDEIARWWSLDEAEKRALREQLRERMRDGQP